MLGIRDRLRGNRGIGRGIRRSAVLLPAALIALALGLAGCSSASSNPGVTHAVTGGVAIAQPAPASGSSTDSSSGSASTGDVVTRQVVTTGSVLIRARNPIAAADKAAAIVDSVGGRVDDRNQTAATKTKAADATLTLRIPTARLTSTLAKLKSIGNELSISESTDDVTTASEDLGARIDALQTSIDRLLALESKATDTADVITIENDISDRQGELESLTAQQRTLNDQVAMATITLHLIAPSTPLPASGPPSPATAFLAGLSGFGAAFTWAFLVLTYLLPWLVLAAVIWIVIVLLLRRRRRRLASGNPSAASPAADTGATPAG